MPDDHGDPDHGAPDHGDPDHGAPDHGDPDHGDPDHMDVARLVADWTTVPDIGARLGLPLSRVRQLIADRELLSARVGERRVVSVPAKFLGAQGPRPELRGTFTVLADGGMNDEQILRWLFTPDDTLPVDGAPIDALIAGHKTEVRRRAQATAF